jgi:signal transduction histidine kinase
MRIYPKTILILLLVSLIPLSLTSIIAYRIAERTFAREVLDHLESVATVQEYRVKSLISQNLERIKFISTKLQMRLSLERFIKTRDESHRGIINQGLLEAKVSSDIKNISILTPDGRVIASTDITEIGTDHSGREYFIRGKRGNCVDVFALDKNQNIVNYLSGPIHLNDRFLGVAVIETSADSIISLVSDYTGLGETGETLLVKRDERGDAQYITPLRFDIKAALRRTHPKHDLKSPTTQALLKKEQSFMDTVDYRGKHVLSVTRYIEETDWGLVAKIDRAVAFEPAIRLRNLSLAVISATIILMVAASLYIGHHITRPIINLIRVSKRINEGDLSIRADTTFSDEIGDLGRSFNEMTENLITARTSLEQKVRERTVQLEDLNKELEAFIYSVSHDLRAPLRSINGFSQAILEDYKERLDEQGRDYLNRIRAASQRMGQLIDDMLRLSRVTRVEMIIEKVNISEVAQVVAHELQKTEPERRVEFIIQKGISLKGDVNLLKIVLENLLDNAWKFTGKNPETRIEFGSMQRDGESVYFVRDNGAGFDMAYADKLFVPFQRLHSIAEFPGTGIGLAIVQRIVRRHGGNIWAEAEVGKGATFYFTIKT